MAWVMTCVNALVPKRRSKIVVHSSPDFDDGALAVLQGLHDRGHDPIILLEEASSAALVGTYVREPVMAVAKNSWRGRYHFLTARHVITTHSVFRKHRPPGGQTVVNIWHGELVKPVGRLDGAPPVPSTRATATSSVGQAFRCAEFDLAPSQVLVVGAPRNDRMLRADRMAVRRAALDGRCDRLLFLSLPTYREAVRIGRVDGAPHTGLLPLDAAATEATDRWLRDHDAVLLAKPHPLAPKPESERYGNVQAIDSEWLTRRSLTLYTLLKGVDCLITDASSVWVDFLLTDRPVVFAFPDIEAYRRTRGLNLEPYELWAPGRLVTTGRELLEEMERIAAGEDGYERVRRDAKLRLHKYTDDRSTSRLLDALEL